MKTSREDLASTPNEYRADSRKAIYGTIAYFGGWSVSFAPEGNSQNICLSGYDKEFPRDRFPNIPVIDFRTCENMRLLPDALVAECFTHKGMFSTYRPLAELLPLYAAAGCTVS
jgi:hypothetical protein